jgi:hypothetical protein
MPVKTALVATLAMNRASAALGAVLIPLVGVAWEIFPGLILYPVFKIGTFSPVTWVATFILAVLVNSGIELFVLKKWFQVRWSERNLAILGAANALSVGLAYASFWTEPINW